MSTTVTVDALARLKELQAEADQIQQDANEKLGKVFAEMRDVSNAASGAYQIQDTNGTAPATAPATTATSSTKKKRRGRPPGKKNATVAKKKVAGKKSDNDQPPLWRVIWNVLSMSSRSWKKSIPNLPPGTTGLRAVDIATIIEAGNLWSSKSPGTMATQISKHIKTFREKGKVTRGDHARYEIVEGANLDD